jgi:hypothetical protein
MALLIHRFGSLREKESPGLGGEKSLLYSATYVRKEPFRRHEDSFLIVKDMCEKLFVFECPETIPKVEEWLDLKIFPFFGKDIECFIVRKSIFATLYPQRLQSP